MEEKNKKTDKKSTELEQLKEKCEEYLSGWKRERADFLNYKKEESDRISGVVKFSNENLLLRLLPILDNFNLAVNHADQNDESIKGFMLIKKQVEDLLIKEGIEQIETSGKPFDPNTMEAIEGDGETVSEELQKGYTMNGKLIRPAKVKTIK